MVHGSRKSPKRFRSLSEIEEKVFGYRLGFWARQFYFYPPGYCWYFIFPMVFRYRRFRIFVLKCGGRDLLLTPSPIYPPPPTPPRGRPGRAGLIMAAAHVVLVIERAGIVKAGGGNSGGNRLD